MTITKLIVAFIVCLFMTKQLNAQKWYKITNNDWGLVALGVVSGSADGVNQNLAHWRWGKGKPFWDVQTSWKNKYKDWDTGDKSARYFGSKTIFVAFTDGFHLTRMIDRSAMLVSVGISAGELSTYPKKDRWKVVLKKMAISGISNRIAFNLIYK
jgi:hypothetical protein